MPETYEIPLPTTVGASRISDPTDSRARVIGAPSIKYPIIRDLANACATVTIEIDTEMDRVVGVIDRVLPASDTSKLPERLVIRSTPKSAARLRPTEHRVSLPDILAFRVLKIEVSELPTTL